MHRRKALIKLTFNAGKNITEFKKIISLYKNKHTQRIIYSNDIAIWLITISYYWETIDETL